jgi:hypothetical protein
MRGQMMPGTAVGDERHISPYLYLPSLAFTYTQSKALKALRELVSRGCAVKTLFGFAEQMTTSNSTALQLLPACAEGNTEAKTTVSAISISALLYAIHANCRICNGAERFTASNDCTLDTCHFYPYRPGKGPGRAKRQATPRKLAQLAAARRARL